MFKKLIGIILGLILFLIISFEANLFAEIPAYYYNFGKSSVSDFENIKLLINSPDQACVLFYSMNTESENVLKVEKNVEQSEIPKTLGEKIRSSKGCYIASLSPGLIPGIYLGYGWITSDSSSYLKENVIVLHVNAIKVIRTAGISITINNFKNLDRKGYFTSVNVGCDYVASLAYVGLLPNVSVGGGYSFKISKNTFFRISWDIGIKVLVSNIKLSIVF